MSKKSQTTTGQPKQRKSVTPAAAGGAKTTKPQREYRSRAEREAEIQSLILRVTTIVGGVLLALLVIALIYDQVIVPNQAVATVNGQAITVAQFRERMRLEEVLISQQLNGYVEQLRAIGFPDDQIFQFLSQQPPYSNYLQELQEPSVLGNRVINDLVDDQIVRDEAAARGITVSDEEVSAFRQEFFGYDPLTAGMPPTATPTPTITPTPFVPPTFTPTPLVSPTPTPTLTPTPEFTAEATVEGTAEATAEGTAAVPTLGPSPTLNATEVREQFDENVTSFYDNLSQQASISNETLDNYFEILALRKKLQEVVAPVGETTLYANARHILVLTQEEANSVIAALNAGESFAGLAITLSQDNGGNDPQSDGGSAAKGGELGWAPVGEYTTGYVTEFAKAIREAQIGQIVGPVQTQFGFHIIQVRAFEERDLTEQEIDSAKSRALDIWLEANRVGKFEIYDNWSSFIG